MSKTRTLFLYFAFLLCLTGGPLLGQSALLFFEAQAVGGYHTDDKRWIFYSLRQEEAMQKPGLGFDYLKRFSGSGGDFALLAVQARLAVNAARGRRFEPQLYNAYFKLKLPAADIWIGHNRPALGLSSVFDTHAHLLPTLAMSGYGFDRDWGIGLGRDFARGNWALSLTSGSGMPLRLEGNALLAGRLGLGVLNQDNVSLGLSAAWGRTIDTMGYEVVSADPKPLRLVGVDFSHFWNNLENRLEVFAGKRHGETSITVFWRLGAHLLPEERLKLELQPEAFREHGKTRLRVAAGISFLATPDLALRIMAAQDGTDNNSRLVVQAYYLKKIALGAKKPS